MHKDKLKNLPLDIFLTFLKLGCTSFGGPIAHLGYFREEFVDRRKWLDEQTYADLIAFCQFLPGPASSQVGISLGLYKGGMWGGVLAWLGFCLPSVIALILFAKGISGLDHTTTTNLIYGLKIVAVAVVAKAIWNMGLKLCFEKVRLTVMSVACITTLLFPHFSFQIFIMLCSAVFGLIFLSVNNNRNAIRKRIPIHNHKIAIFFLFIFFSLLIGLFWLDSFTNSIVLLVIGIFYKVGSLVFGGGHVVLPLLSSELVPQGWISQDLFMAGYGAAQAVPGPLFTFSAYLGASIVDFQNVWVGGFVCLAAIYLPSFLLIYGGLPFWESIRSHTRIQSALSGINAAVVGLLLAALYNPVWVGAIHNIQDFSLALSCFILLTQWKCPAWFVVLICSLYGWIN